MRPYLSSFAQQDPWKDGESKSDHSCDERSPADLSAAFKVALRERTTHHWYPRDL